MIRLEKVLKTSLQDVLKMSWKYLSKTSWRCLEDVFARRLEDDLTTSWKRLEDVLKTYDQDEYIDLDQDVFWRRMSKVNIFVLIKTSSEDKDERRLQDVFIKTNLCWVIALDCRQSKYLITIFLNFRLGFCGSFFLCYFQNSSFVVKKF